MQTATGETPDVVVVTFTKQRNLRSYRRRFADPLTVVTDPDLTFYNSMGFTRGSVWRVYGWRAIITYARLLGGGARMTRSEEDTFQLGGNVLLAADGQLVWRYHGAGPDDRPSFDELRAAVADLP